MNRTNAKQDKAAEKREAEAALRRAQEKRRQASADGRYEVAEYWDNYAHDVQRALEAT